MLRAIREIKPRFVVGENVYGLLNWSEGLVFEEVQVDLENEGYEVQPIILPACAVNAPHRRDRIWFVANSVSDGHQLRGLGKSRREKTKSQSQGNQRQRVRDDSRRNGEQRAVAYSGQKQLQGSEFNRGTKEARSIKEESRQFSGSICNQWENFPTQPPICGGDDGLPSELDGITFPKWRQKSIKAYGNAIVPQVAFEIFKAIEQTYEKP